MPDPRLERALCAVGLAVIVITAPFLPPARSSSAVVERPTSTCTTTHDPGPVGPPLMLLNGVALANLHNTAGLTGSVKQCHNAAGLTTSIAISGIWPIRPGPAGFPEAAYGYDLYDRTRCPACRSEPFPFAVSRLEGRDRDYRLAVKYSLDAPSPSSLPHDFIYDLWLEQHPSPGRAPRPGDVEVLIFLYEHRIAGCLASPTSTSFSASIWFAGRRVSSRWQVCQIRGGTEATPVAFFLRSPAQARVGTISLRIRDFIEEAEAFLGGDLSSHLLMGVELGGEFDQCSPATACVVSTFSWQWRVSWLALESRTAAIPIVFAAAR
jgi:hypothetical protein